MNNAPEAAVTPQAAVDEPAVDEQAADEQAAHEEVADQQADDEEVADGDQAAFDINDFPGGARSAIEAVLMVVDEPVTELALASALELPLDTVREHVQALAQDYTEGRRGFTLRRVGGGWRVHSRADYAPVVEKFLMDGQQARLTQAALETLAVVAYRQPISRARIGAIRGVNVDSVVRTLVARGLIEEVGSDGETSAILYGTTQYFLQRLGLNGLDELPALAPYLPEVDALDELAAQGRA